MLGDEDTTGRSVDAASASILLVHERYRVRAGEDSVFDAEYALLAAKGRDVRRLVVDNDTISTSSLSARLRLGIETIWSRNAARLVTERLQAEPADIVHIHNTFPLLSPSIYRAAGRAGAAVVQTIHNFRPICPAATLYRDDRPCHDCVGRLIAWPSILHACYRDSRLQTLPVAGMLAVQRLARSWEDVDAIVALTSFAAAQLIEGGLPSARMHVRGNVVAPTDAVRQGPGRGFLYLGRWSREKGVDTLLAAAEALPTGIEIIIAGDGPPDGPQRQGARIVRTGRLDAGAVRSALAGSRALLFPSRWYEGMPLVILEAFATGVPVIAARIGAAAELVDDGETGLLFEPGDHEALVRHVRWAEEHPDEMLRMGRAALRRYQERFTAEAGYDVLVDIYASALARAHTRRRPRQVRTGAHGR